MLTTEGQERLSTTTLPSAPAHEPPTRDVEPREETSSGPRWWLYILLFVLIVPVLAVIGWRLLSADDETAAIEMQDEYLVDSPGLPALAFVGQPRYVGQDANLDPDLAYMQGEFDVDSSFLAPLAVPPAMSIAFLGQDVNLDADLAYMQGEFDVDTAFLAPIAIPRAMPYFVGGDVAFDGDIRWMQSEYDIDTPTIPVVVVLSGPGWVGQDAGLD